MSKLASLFTYREIFDQPDVWEKTYQVVFKEKEKINLFLNKYVSENTEYIFTGAGTSAFIGDILSFLYPKKNIFQCRSVSTTDITTHSQQIFNKNKKYVLISFSRSGSSPESMAALDIANEICGENIAHIIITCNNDGKLVKMNRHENVLIVALPPETNDKGLAMTGSFSSMLLTALLIADIENIGSKRNEIQTFCEKGRYILRSFSDQIKEISRLHFDRAVFLGSGELKGIAEECHLKLQELTDGKVMCAFDSFLGFRHGPKAILNEKTLVVYLFSDDRHIFNYEKDLAIQIDRQTQTAAKIFLAMENIKIDGVQFQLEIIPPATATKTDYDTILYVLIGQLMGLFKSLELGLDPDNPSTSGKISRVVEGVKIYNQVK